ncbi:MAG: YiiX/YebB-like N1pC/P60 family cysteine hydrolase [Polyangiaceae bacterium]
MWLTAMGCRAAPPAFADGDLIFQESSSAQSDMVRALTRSRWTHLGVIFKDKAGYTVLEAASPVRRTPLAHFVARGRGKRYVVKRWQGEAFDAARLRQIGASFVGRPYDLKFRWDDQSLYCSELVFKLFERAAAIRLGKVERARDMNLDDPKVASAMKARFAGARFDPEETVITPDAIFNDERLVQVFP